MGVRYTTIDADNDDQRIDNYLLAQFRGIPKSLVYRLLRTGQVRVNKKRIKPTYRLQIGDEVRLPPVAVKPPKPKPTVVASLAEELEQRVLYEDEQLMIINKPSGLAVHGGSQLSLALIDAVRQMRPTHRFWELAHRLDKETSGCLILAKKRSALRTLHDIFRAGQIEKTYTALLVGNLTQSTTVTAPLQKNQLQSGERMVRVDSAGRAAKSFVQVTHAYANMTLAEVKIATGRTHQIRVHCAHIGHPVAGDSKYGDKRINQRLRELGLKRLFLHASRLRFRLSPDSAMIEVGADLEPELQQLLTRLDNEKAI